MIEKKTLGADRVTGFYRGIVKKHSSNGKCKIFWPGVMPEEYSGDEFIDKLPDAEQAAPLFGVSSGSSLNSVHGNGLFFYPAVGSVVWGFFANEDVNHPVYFAASMDTRENSRSYELQRNSLIKDGPKLVLGDEINPIEIKFDSKDVTFEVKSSQNRSTLSNKPAESKIIIERATGNVTVTSTTGSVNVNGLNVNIEAEETVSITAKQLIAETKNSTNVSSSGPMVLRSPMGLTLKSKREEKNIV